MTDAYIAIFCMLMISAGLGYFIIEIVRSFKP